MPLSLLRWGLVALLLHIVQSQCSQCCPSRNDNKCIGETDGGGYCCPFRTRCCLVGGKFTCCAGSETCVADQISGCVARIPAVVAPIPFTCATCCLGQGMCGSLPVVTGSCCPEYSQCCLVGPSPLPGYFQCCALGAKCVRDAITAINVCQAAPAPLCQKCCLGDGRCEGLTQRDLSGTCCAGGETCCLSGSQARPGAFTCCQNGLEDCVHTAISLLGLCVPAKNQTGFTPLAVCQGEAPLRDPVTLTTLQCGVGTPQCPDSGTGSYCDTVYAFPTNPWQGVCCPMKAKTRVADCRVKIYCSECLTDQCVWLTYDNTCHPTCPFPHQECVSGDPVKRCPRSRACYGHINCGNCTNDGCVWLPNTGTCTFACPVTGGFQCLNDARTCYAAPVQDNPLLLPGQFETNTFYFSGSCVRRCGIIGAARPALFYNPAPLVTNAPSSPTNRPTTRSPTVPTAPTVGTKSPTRPTPAFAYYKLGCFADQSNSPVFPAFSDVDPWSEVQCYQTALATIGFSAAYFARQSDIKCSYGNATTVYDKYGSSTNCNYLGGNGQSANEVWQIGSSGRRRLLFSGAPQQKQKQAAASVQNGNENDQDENDDENGGNDQDQEEDSDGNEARRLQVLNDQDGNGGNVQDQEEEDSDENESRRLQVVVYPNSPGSYSLRPVYVTFGPPPFPGQARPNNIRPPVPPSFNRPPADPRTLCSCDPTCYSWKDCCADYQHQCVTRGGA